MLIFRSSQSVDLAESRVNNENLARELIDSNVSSVKVAEKAPLQAPNRVEARSKTHPPCVVDVFVTYRPVLSFMSDLYFGTPSLYPAQAKIDSVFSRHQPTSVGPCSRGSLLLCFIFQSGNLLLRAQNSLRWRHSPPYCSVLLPFYRLLLPMAAARYWPAPQGSLA